MVSTILKFLALHTFFWHLSWATSESPGTVNAQDSYNCEVDGADSCVQDASVLLQTSLTHANENSETPALSSRRMSREPADQHNSQIAAGVARKNRSVEALHGFKKKLSAAQLPAPEVAPEIIPVPFSVEPSMAFSLIGTTIVVWLTYKLSVSNLTLEPRKSTSVPEAESQKNGFVAEGPCTIIAWCMLALVLFMLSTLGFHQWAEGGAAAVYAIRGLTAWTIFIPIGIVLLLAASLGILTNPRISSFSKKLWLFVLALLWVSIMAAGVFLARVTLACGVIFCFGSSVADGVNSAPFGLWLLLVGAVFLLGLFIMYPAWMKKSNGGMAYTAFPSRMRSRKAVELACGLCLSLVVLPTLFFLSTILGNQVDMFSPAEIAEFEALTVTDAEFQGAWLSTMNVKLSDELVMKIFPDTLLYFSFLEVIALTAVAANMLPSFGRWLNKKGNPDGFTNGEKIAMALFGILLILWVHYWLLDHSYHDGKAAIDLWWWERIARTWGQTAVLFMSLLLLPASKNSLWLKCMGISWERSLWVHRWLGYATLVCIAGHILSFWARFSEIGTFPYDAFATVLYYPVNSESLTRGDAPSYSNFTIGQQEMIAYPAVFMIAIGVVYRRKYWELFKYFHFVFLLLIPAVLMHAASSWYFMIGGVTFWLLDAAIRFATVVTPPACLLEGGIIPHKAEDGFTELRMNWTHAEPGQFAWIKVPSISAWEWHPFSLSSGIDDGYAQMCIKNMGPGTWTEKLYELGKEASVSSTTFDIQVDGPYGPYLEMGDHGARLLIAGGIGITQVHSIFRTIAQLVKRAESIPQHLENVHLVWIGRTRELFKVFGDSLKECVGHSTDKLQLQATFFQTQPASYDSADDLLTPTYSPEIKFLFGRPSFAELYANAIQTLGDKSLLVQACGPEAMIEAAEDAARGNDQVDFESMLFVL
mmetsp:Transcript_16247/g.29954  ORF Transcript_16247/g.29954 Transcript_16247/m.29954 type:complete len:929 (-) Transcript_16247:33-2819(-)